QYEVLNVTAHDLKNPLSLMPLLADMIIQNKDNPAAIEKIAKQIKTAGKRMTRTIDDLLTAARENTVKVQLRLTSINLSKIVKGVVSSNRALARRKDQEIKTSLPAECIIYGDHRRITEIIDNLINNAIKFSDYEKDIYVSLKIKRKMAVLEVNDNGPGLTKDDQKNLFRKFTSLSAKPTGGEISTG